MQLYADAGDLAVLSVAYRLAPENPYPQGPQDCIDVGEYLVKNSEKEYGGPLRFIGGEVRFDHFTKAISHISNDDQSKLRDFTDGAFAP